NGSSYVAAKLLSRSLFRAQSVEDCMNEKPQNYLFEICLLKDASVMVLACPSMLAVSSTSPVTLVLCRIDIP
ncbi:hypothetical protein Tco_0443643, partial [Tanacetum coccineum]